LGKAYTYLRRVASRMYGKDDVIVSTNEREFIHEGLKHDIRVDGRQPLDMRNVKINFGQNVGSVEVQLGTTRALATVSAEIVPPFPERPSEGFLNFFVDFSPMASPSFQANRPSDKAVELSRVVERGIKESRALDTEALCLVAGEKVWAIRCDVHVTDCGGNMTDAVNLAAVIALLHFRRPDVTVVGGKVTVHPTDDRQPMPLAIHHVPISLTCAFFKIDDQVKIVADPGLKEEAVCEGVLTVTVNVHKEICCVQKAGGLAISAAQVLFCSKLAASKAEQLTTLINSRLEEDKVNVRSNLRLAGQAGYLTQKKAVPVGVGKDELGNPLVLPTPIKTEQEVFREVSDDDEI